MTLGRALRWDTELAWDLEASNARKYEPASEDLILS